MRAEKSKRNFWLPAEIECMLNLIRNVQMLQGTTATTHYTFVQIANKMRRKGFPNKSPTQIRRKWFQMKSAYLCYKRGNTERLLLIPEKFRSVIAEFVDTEYKVMKPHSTPEPPDSPIREAPCAVPKLKLKTEFAKPKPTNEKGHFSEFVSHMKQTHKIMNQEFLDMQKTLMLFEQSCQAQRDANLIAFIKSMKFEM